MPDIPRASVIIPARDEGPVIGGTLDSLGPALPPGCEVLVVVDDPADSTRTALAGRADVRCVVSSYGRGPANAIRFGLDAARGPVAVVTMADGRAAFGQPARIYYAGRCTVLVWDRNLLSELKGSG